MLSPMSSSEADPPPSSCDAPTRVASKPTDPAYDASQAVDIRNFSVKCGRCGEYQTIVRFRALDAEWNEYVYECESPPCSGDPSSTRTLLEVPTAFDVFARRDPTWHGGEVHAGAKHGSDDDATAG